MKIKSIESAELREALQYNIDQKTKPLGSLGRIEEFAIQIGLIQQNTFVELKNPTMLSVAADHEIINEGFASAPAEITWQQVLNFLNGGGGIGCFCTQVGMKLKVADAGVDYDFDDHPDLFKVKVRKATRNFLIEHAMTTEECCRAITNGADIVASIASSGCNIIGFGEMGIGNTTPASALLAAYTGESVDVCVGPGVGITDEALQLKKKTIGNALEKHGIDGSAEEILAKFGGLEIATIAGGMLEAARRRMVILVDGFITSSALLAAFKIDPRVKEYAIFAHKSKEPGHKLMMDYIGVDPVLDLELRLGEGTGAALVYPVIENAVAMLNNMTSFTEAKVFNVSDSRL